MANGYVYSRFHTFFFILLWNQLDSTLFVVSLKGLCRLVIYKKLSMYRHHYI